MPTVVIFMVTPPLRCGNERISTLALRCREKKGASIPLPPAGRPAARTAPRATPDAPARHTSTTPGTVEPCEGKAQRAHGFAFAMSDAKCPLFPRKPEPSGVRQKYWVHAFARTTW